MNPRAQEKLHSAPAESIVSTPMIFRRASLGSLLAVGMLAGCGHPASREECDEIFARSAEIELRAQNITDPKVIAQRTAEARAARGEELMGRCLGKRITQSALECVRTANTSEQLDRCLD